MDWDKYVKSLERDITGEWRGRLKLIKKLQLHENKTVRIICIPKNKMDCILLLTMERKGGCTGRKYGGWSVYWGHNNWRWSVYWGLNDGRRSVYW